MRARASFTGCCFLKSQLIVLKTGSNSQLLIPPKKMPELVSELDSTTSYRSGIFPLPRSRRRRVFENIQYEASFENIPYRGLWLVVIAVLPIPYSPSPPPSPPPTGEKLNLCGSRPPITYSPLPMIVLCALATLLSCFSSTPGHGVRQGVVMSDIWFII